MLKLFMLIGSLILGSTTGSIGSNDLIQAVVSSSDRQFNSGNNQTYYSQFNSGLSHSLPLIWRINSDATATVLQR